MKQERKDLPKSQIELTLEFSVDELQPFLIEAAQEISQHKNIAGFRPGKAPYEIVSRSVGEMFIYQTAANFAIEDAINKFLDNEKIEIVGEPALSIQKLAPNNPLVAKINFIVLPKIKLADISSIKIPALPEIKVEVKEIDKIIENLRDLRVKEICEEKPAANSDKVEIDFSVLVDNVPIENGQAKKHPLILGQGTMIPGFEENIIGLKTGEEKEFELAFPDKYPDKKMAGKKATFKVKIIAVCRREMPEINEEFAKGFGFENMQKLRSQLEENIKLDKTAREEEKQEIAMLEQLVEKSEFSDLPDQLIDEETHKMLHELEDNASRQGMKFNDYLAHLKKTEADLLVDFVPDAIKRVKTSLAIREFAKQENITANEQEINEEIEHSLAHYKTHPTYAGQISDLEKNMRSSDGRRYFENALRNKKAIAKLKELII